RAIPLFDAFADSSDPDSALTYTGTTNTSPSLFRSTAIDPATGVLTLSFAPDASGAADLTVRATDTGGLFVETTFAVTVAAVNAALYGLRSDPAAGFAGAASVTIESNDLGNSGSGGALSDADTVAITVANELPPPTISISGAAVLEPDGGATADAVFTVTLSEPRPYSVSVQYATQDGADGISGRATAP